MFKNAFTCFNKAFGFDSPSRLVFEKPVENPLAGLETQGETKPLGQQLDAVINTVDGQINTIKNFLLKNNINKADILPAQQSINTLENNINERNREKTAIRFSNDPKTFAATANILKNKYADVPGVMDANGYGVIQLIASYNTAPDASSVQGHIADFEYNLNKKLKEQGKKPITLSLEPKDFAATKKLIEEDYKDEPGATEVLKAITAYTQPKDPSDIQARLVKIAEYINDNGLNPQQLAAVRLSSDPANFRSTLNQIKNQYSNVSGAKEAMDTINAYLTAHAEEEALNDSNLWKDSKNFEKTAQRLINKFGYSEELRQTLDAIKAYINLKEKLRRVRFGIFQKEADRANMALTTIEELNKAAGIIEGLLSKKHKEEQASGVPYAALSAPDLQEVSISTTSIKQRALDRKPSEKPLEQAREKLKVTEIKEISGEEAMHELIRHALAHPKVSVMKAADIVPGRKNIANLKKFSIEESMGDGQRTFTVVDTNNQSIPVTVRVGRNNGGQGIPVALELSWDEKIGNAVTTHQTRIGLEDFVLYSKQDKTYGMDEKTFKWAKKTNTTEEKFVDTDPMSKAENYLATAPAGAHITLISGDGLTEWRITKETQKIGQFVDDKGEVVGGISPKFRIEKRIRQNPDDAWPQWAVNESSDDYSRAALDSQSVPDVRRNSALAFKGDKPTKNPDVGSQDEKAKIDIPKDPISPVFSRPISTGPTKLNDDQGQEYIGSELNKALKAIVASNPDIQVEKLENINEHEYTKGILRNIKELSGYIPSISALPNSKEKIDKAMWALGEQIRTIGLTDSVRKELFDLDDKTFAEIRANERIGQGLDLRSNNSFKFIVDSQKGGLILRYDDGRNVSEVVIYKPGDPGSPRPLRNMESFLN